MAATLKCDTIQNASSATANITLDTAGNATVGNTLAMGSSFLRNRLINGDMSVYQRGSVSATTTGAYTLDRWFVTPTGATVTVTQSTSVVPTGFADSLNVAGAASVTNVSVRQRIESVNTQDLASGVQVTVSGWIRQSTGSAVTTATIALAAPTALDNYTSTTSAATTYTLPSIPNATWTTFSNTFTLTASCVNGLQVTIALGTGLTTGSFNLTGLQLEVGSVATPFERRQYGQELMLCQRYYEISNSIYLNPQWNGYTTSGSPQYAPAFYKVTKRATPGTIVLTNQSNNLFPATVGTLSGSNIDGFYELRTANGTGQAGYFASTFTASAEL
jgi:hypothetical protein